MNAQVTREQAGVIRQLRVRVWLNPKGQRVDFAGDTGPDPDYNPKGWIRMPSLDYVIAVEDETP